MIESSGIKKFIIDYFIENSKEHIADMATNIYTYLASGFVLNEVVHVKKQESDGKITMIRKDGYVVLSSSDGQRCDVFQSGDLARKEELSPNKINHFLGSITMETFFGRVLKENAYKSIFNSKNVFKCVVPQSQAGERPAAADAPYKNGTAHRAETQGAPEGRQRRDEQKPEIPKRFRREEREAEYDQESIKKLRIKPANVKPERRKEESLEPQEHGDILSNVLELCSRSAVEIEMYGSSMMDTLMKVYSFVSNFSSFFDLKEMELQELAEAIRDPTYESPVVYKIHSKLIEAIGAEIAEHGIEDFVHNVDPALMIVDETAKSMGNKTREGPAGAGADGWRMGVRSFVQQLADEASKSMGIFIECADRKTQPLATDQLLLRLAFIDFLLNSFFTTGVFRDMLSEKTKALKDLEKKRNMLAQKLKKIRSSMRSTVNGKKDAGLLKQKSSAEADLRSVIIKIFHSPLKIEIGSIGDVSFLNINKKIYALYKSVYYMLSRDVIFRVSKRYGARNKAEKKILQSLEQYAGCLPDD
jgi:hypothetical protein